MTDSQPQAISENLWRVLSGKLTGVRKLSKSSSTHKSLTGQAVVIHRTSGRRRTGTAIATYPIANGATYAEALVAVTTANSTAEMRAVQLNFL